MLPGSDTHLTARECQILELVAEDLTNAEIAARLGIKESTVGHHLEDIYRKAGGWVPEQGLWRGTCGTGARPPSREICRGGIAGVARATEATTLTVQVLIADKGRARFRGICSCRTYNDCLGGGCGGSLRPWP